MSSHLYPLLLWFKFRRPRGFTLIELLVVIIILGLLTAVALPSLISIIGRSREVEAKKNLSSIAYAQQGYHFEHRSFADSYASLDLALSAKYYTYNDPSLVLDGAVSNAVSVDLGNGTERSYSIGVYMDTDAFQIIFCESRDGLTTTQAPNALGGDCSNGGKRIK